MVKHYWQAVHKGVALCRSEKKAPETEQRKTSVADGAASGVAIDDAGEGGAFPVGWTSATLKKNKKNKNQCIRRWEMGAYDRERDKQELLYDGCSRGM